MAQTIGTSNKVDVWADDGTVVEPASSKVDVGWQLGEQPPHEFMNWLQNTFGQKLNHVLQHGVARWNDATEYGVGDFVTHNDQLYRAINVNTNSEPPSSNWDVSPGSDLGQNIAVFDTPGVTSWAVPAVLQSGLRKAKIIVTGGGGGGAEMSVEPGSNGETSSFGFFMSATGGNGALDGTLASGAEGGVGSGGDINIPGGSSGGGGRGAPSPGMPGAASYWGGGTDGRTNNPAAIAYPRYPGAPGSGVGASAADGDASPASAAGGTALGIVDLSGQSSVAVTVGAGGEGGGGAPDGADGIIVVEW